MGLVVRGLLIIGALTLLALPALAYAAGRSSLVLPFVAVALSALCSFLAYRAAVVLRRRIDQIGEGGERRGSRRSRSRDLPARFNPEDNR